MRKRERRANERRQAQADYFEVMKDELYYYAFMHPIFRRNLEIALSFPCRSREEQNALFENMVRTNAAFCLSGDPEYRVSAEFQCHFLIEMVDFLAHARPALMRAVELYREAWKPMPNRLGEWAENPGHPPPQKRGPPQPAQDWKALRDQIIALAVDGGVAGQKGLRWKVSSGRAGLLEEEWRSRYSICRAVVELLEEDYGDRPNYHLPTYDMVWNAWRRYRNELRPNGKRRAGRSLLPPQGLEPVVNPPGIDTVEMRQTVRNITTKIHLGRCAQRDPDDSQ